MNRRHFLMSICILLVVGLNQGCMKDNKAYSETPQIFTKVVSKLKLISNEKRSQLSLNTDQLSPAELNSLIPEINELELNNNFNNAQTGHSLKIIAWNMERGRHWRDCVKLINEHPALVNPDFIFLGEMDFGMARSANEHTTQQMADSLKMNYLYGVEFLELTNGEKEERIKYPGVNDRGFHGNAILSKYPLKNVKMIRFPGIDKWYNSYQKRLGGRMALMATVTCNNQNITLVSTHLESDAGQFKTRYEQMNWIINELAIYSPKNPVLMGGDLNAILQERLFFELRKNGFLIEECNEIGQPTQQIFENGKVKLAKHQIDYLLVKDMEVKRDKFSPRIIPAAYPPDTLEKMLGDHAVVVVKVKLY